MPRLFGPALFLAVTFIFAACDRPFVDPRPPELELLAPSVNQIFEDSVVTIKVRASSFRLIDHIEIDGREMAFDPIDDTWVDTVTLALGVNDFRVEAIDVAGVEGVEEVSLIRMQFQFSNESPTLPPPFRIGEHTATLLPDGRLILIGGAPGMVDPALNTAFSLDPEAPSFELLPNRMIRGRTGHATARLPDGRLLVLGGASRGTPVQLSHLVPEVELFDPATNRFIRVPYVGPPIARAYHVMFITTDSRGTVIDVQGGIGENETDTRSEIKPLRDFQTFRFARDTLFAVGDGGVAVDGIGEIYSHTVAPLDPEGASSNGRYLVAGTYYTETSEEKMNFTIDFDSSPLQIIGSTPFVQGRFRHATATLQPGIIFSFGGRIFLGGPVLQNSEVYVESLDQFFLFENESPSQRRHGHTATKLPSGRILLVGGFIGNGDALSSTEYFNPGFGF
ncbi:MAG: kelch repeat-containing protein [Rhodothermales bacterium]|nr:kelch repeat-containing protein [Rhodothermales bacterium]